MNKNINRTTTKIVQREYNQYVTNEIVEDFSLRYAPARHRKWSEFVVANTAIGNISFLALEAIGASIALSYGFQNAFWGIVVASIIIFLMGIPICYQAAKNNIDIDLLTRASGFGYLGSTITSLIYASFCFIFFALEAAIMAQAIYLYTGLPLELGYLLCSIIIIPIVYYGMTLISRIHMLTQPFWLVLMFLPFIMVIIKEPDLYHSFVNLTGSENGSSDFDLYHFGFALGISLALIPQIGEQVDYLRFMPDKTKDNALKWWSAVLLAGPGWIILGFLKQIGGILLAALVLLGGASIIEAKEPIHMFNEAYHYVFDNPQVALAVSFIFVMISQIKINITNAYAGSLAWSNFFSRLTHSHPGRIVWVFFNIAIAILLMEMGLFDILGKILGLYSNVAIAWVSAIVADLVINKTLGISPPIIDFKRAHLFTINPVGTFSTLIASVLSIIAFSGLVGEMLQAFSSIVALVTAFICVPIIGLLTKGKYYIARQSDDIDTNTVHECGVCKSEYSARDIATCNHYECKICALCCSLEGRCHDSCKDETEFSLTNKLVEKIKPLGLGFISLNGLKRLMSFFVTFLSICGSTGLILWMIYILSDKPDNLENLNYIQSIYFNIFYVLSLVSLIAAWLIILMYESREYVEEELTLINENLVHAKKRADDANQAKSTFLSNMSHELRTPMHGILSFSKMGAKRVEKSSAEKNLTFFNHITTSGERLLTLLNDLLDLAKLEAGKMEITYSPSSLINVTKSCVAEQQARLNENKLNIHYLPVNISGQGSFDEIRIGQVITNFLSNAIKFSPESGIIEISISSTTLNRHSLDLQALHFSMKDQGGGIPEDELKSVFDKFVQSSSNSSIGTTKGTGLGLPICREIIEQHHGETWAENHPDGGAIFSFVIPIEQPEVSHLKRRDNELTPV